MADKFPTVDGIVYAMPVNSGISKKNKPYSISTLVVEIEGSYEKDGKTINNNQLVEFKLSKSAEGMLNTFDVKDPIRVVYKLGGRKYEKPDGKVMYMNEPFALALAHPDIQNGKPAKVQKEEIFVAPNPLIDDLPEDDLPF